MMDSEPDNEPETNEEEMAKEVSLEDAAGAECLACGVSLNSETGAVVARSPGLIESASRALGENAFSGGKLGCRRCYDLLHQFRKADLHWRGLRDQLLEVLLAKPSAQIGPVSDKIEFCDVLIKNEQDVDGDVPADTASSVGADSPARDDDSDDEPLYKHKENWNNKLLIKTEKETPKTEIEPVIEWSCRECRMEFNQKASAAIHVVRVHKIDPAVDTGAVIETRYQDAKKKKFQKKHKRKFGGNDSDKDNSVKKYKTRKGIAEAKLTKKTLDDDIVIFQKTIKKLCTSSDVTIRTKKENSEPSTFSNVADYSVTIKPANSLKVKKEVFACTECPSSFFSEARLNFHKVKHAASKGPFICEVCGASYKHKKACDIHVQMHNGVSPWKCSVCGKIFPSKGALSRHEAIHTGTPNYQCDLCGKSFIHTSSFKMHKLSHSGIKPHSCSKCGLALMTKSHLKRHQRVHSGEKRHECNVCGKKFSERYNLYAHQKSHEASENQRQTKSHDCSVCESTFNRKHLLEKHMETVHYIVSYSNQPKKPRNTMNKLLKKQSAVEAEETKYSSIMTEPKVEIMDVKPFTSSSPIDQVNRNSSSNTLIGDMILAAATSTSTARNGLNYQESNNDALTNHQPWKGVENYHLTNDYPLRMHGVDYVGYLNRQK